jgi:predicted MFS family arabinose efflux permease
MRRLVNVSATPAATVRQPGFVQGLMLLLPVTMSVVGVSVFAATVAQMQEHFRHAPPLCLLGACLTSDYQVNYLQTMPGIWILLFSPLAGWLADRYGRRTLLLWAMILYAIVGVSPFFLDDIRLIALTRCGVGVCESMVMTVTTTMISDYFKGGSRERWLAGQTGVASFSALLIIPLGGVLGARFGWQGPFLVYGYSLFLAIGVATFCWEPARETEAAALVSADSRYTAIPLARMAGILAITVIGSILFYATVTQNANALVTLGVTDPARIALYCDIASIGVPIGTVLFALLGRLHIGWLLGVDFLLVGIGFTLMGHAADPTTYAWAANVQQVGCGLILPTLLVWATRGLAYNVRGRGNGMWQGAFALGSFFSGATLTLLAKQMGGLLPAFSGLGRMCLTAAAVAAIATLIRRREPIPSAAT